MAETRRKKQPTGLHGRAEEIAEILKLLGNPQRLLIACLLCEGEEASPWFVPLLWNGIGGYG